MSISQLHKIHFKMLSSSMYTCFVILLNLLKKKKVNVEMTIGKVATKN